VIWSVGSCVGTKSICDHFTENGRLAAADASPLPDEAWVIATEDAEFSDQLEAGSRFRLVAGRCAELATTGDASSIVIFGCRAGDVPLGYMTLSIGDSVCLRAHIDTSTVCRTIDRGSQPYKRRELGVELKLHKKSGRLDAGENRYALW